MGLTVPELTHLAALIPAPGASQSGSDAARGTLPPAFPAATFRVGLDTGFGRADSGASFLDDVNLGRSLDDRCNQEDYIRHGAHRLLLVANGSSQRDQPGFIQRALEEAAKSLAADLGVEPVIERDTQNVPGDVWREVMRYGIGKHANQAQDTGRGDLIFHTKFPLGTDPDAMDNWFEEEAIRRGLIPGQRRQLQPEKPHPGKIFNEALLRAAGHKDAKKRERPQEVIDALKDDEGNELDIIEHELPKIYEPDPQLREDE